MRSKRGLALEELGKIIIYMVLLVVLLSVAIVLFKGKGGDLIRSIGNIMRFGR